MKLWINCLLLIQVHFNRRRSIKYRSSSVSGIQKSNPNRFANSFLGGIQIQLLQNCGTFTYWTENSERRLRKNIALIFLVYWICIFTCRFVVLMSIIVLRDSLSIEIIFELVQKHTNIKVKRKDGIIFLNRSWGCSV